MAGCIEGLQGAMWCGTGVGGVRREGRRPERERDLDSQHQYRQWITRLE